MTNFKNTLRLASATATVLALSPLSVLAATIDLKSGLTTDFPIGELTPGTIVGGAINLILISVTLIAFLFLLIGGVQWVMAGGDKEGTEKARKRITAALVGLAITFSAYAIAFIVNAVFGVNVFTLTLPSLGNK